MLRGMSLRRKLVLSIVALFVIVTIVTGLTSFAVARKSLTRQLDEQVRQTIGRAVDQHRGRNLPPADQDDPGRGIGGDFLLLEIRNGSVRQFAAYTKKGVRVEKTEKITRALLTAELDERPRTVYLGSELGNYRLARQETGRSVVIAGLPLRRMEDPLESILYTNVMAGLIGLVLLGGGATWLIRANLAALERVAAVAGRVSRTPLSTGAVELPERIAHQDTDTRTEVGQVGAAFNEMLDHVDRSLQARHESEMRLRRFVADASHELRTPLASIRGYAELSRKETEPVPEGVRHALDRIDSESARMASLVEDLLLLARLDAGRPLAAEEVDLTVLVIDAVSDARAAGPGHRWQLDLPESAVETVGDRARITQVVVNLLANARVHTPEGTTVTASVRAVPAGQEDGGPAAWAVITVADDGPGIPEELQPRVFARFTRGDEARTRVSGSEEGSGPASTGLGLSIVQAVVSAHHGQVSVDSSPGRTVFTVRLPMSSAAPQPAERPQATA
ncbi:two-component system, OmpR family, sensor kinase [Austwickia chelonae]|uniref:histidine kinase n=2 Tax=Austwickia TaxID=1184606 RepID=K6VTA1_9MICO|nr:putative two-component sensor kinase [Austwickia chelonae NBRC 105200]SEW40587.1 two-component system, OmpR family, sensor kinase [Austwickia chelonae]